MNLLWLLLFSFGLMINDIAASNGINSTEIILNIIAEGGRRLNAQIEARWNHEVNMTYESELKLQSITDENAIFWKKSTEWIRTFGWENFKSLDLQNQSKALIKMATFILPEADKNELAKLSGQMQSHYANVRVCEFQNRTKCDIPLQPDLLKLFANNRNADELKYYWREFHDKAGKPMRKQFEKYIELSNNAAKLNNFTSAADAWLKRYEYDDFLQQMEKIYLHLRPLYVQIHAYVRHRLRQFYGNESVSKDGPIPIHLLGDLWGQMWPSILDIISPFPKKRQFNITDEMLRQGFTVRKMFEKGEEFFTSLNFSKLPDEFWNRSILEKPKDGRHMLCHGGAWYFYRKNDVRIKQCAEVNYENFNGLHHELGYIYHYLHNQDIPYMYQFTGNIGLQEILGDLASLSAATPKYLQRVGLLRDFTYDNQTRLNQLFLSALNNVVALPFILSVDKYRLALYRGEIDKNDSNSAYWRLRSKYSGLEPIERSENDFDPAALYHVIAGLDYMRYFVSFVVQFQLHKTACQMAGQYDPNNATMPLDNCDIYGSVKVGNALKSIMSMGSTKSWPDLLESFTGERKIDGAAMAEYYEPLRAWLEVENAKNNVTLGWTL